MKGAVWSLVVRLARVMPPGVRAALCRLCFAAARGRAPADALRELLSLEAALEGSIDEAAIDYEGGIHPKHRLTRYHGFFVERVKAGEKVLDVGCGNGALAYSLAAAGALVTAIDLDGGKIRSARERYRHGNLSFVEGDATEKLPGGPFDAIVLSNVLEHLRERPGFLRVLQGTYAPRRLLVRVPDYRRHWKVPLMEELGMTYFNDPTHQVEHRREQFEEEMAAAGLSVSHLQVNWGEIWAEVRGDGEDLGADARP